MRSTPTRSLICAIFLLLGASPRDASAQGTEYVFKGKRIVGLRVDDQGADAVVNTFNSPNPRMTFGLERAPAATFQKAIPWDDPYRDYLVFLRREKASGKDEAEVEFEAGQKALAAKWHDVAEDNFLRTLSLKKDHAGALAKLDPKALVIAKRSDRRFNSELAERIEKWMAIDNAYDRKKAFDLLVADFAWNGTLVELERARRSRKEPRGRRDEVLISVGTKNVSSTYAVFVPESYDPLTPIPLVIGLHGGGPDGKDGKGVIGSGKSAMNFYASGAAREGYIVVCPQAVRAPWSRPENDALFLNIYEEITALYNIDLNRVYLTGHSMGGFGTWHFGPKYAHLWAAIAPMSGGGANGIEKLVETKTGVYLHHGADDPVVRVGGSRQAAEDMARRRMDFVYTEIPDSGHGFPDDVNLEMWEFFATHRLAVAPNRADKGKFTTALLSYSSFRRKPSEDEKLYLGLPGEDLPTDRKSLMARLRLGGGAGRAAADLLVKAKDPASLKEAGAIAADEKQKQDVRRFAIDLLAALATPETTSFLLKAAQSDELSVAARGFRALGEVKDPAAVKTLPKCFAKLNATFSARANGKAMDYTDYEDGLATLAEAAGAVRALADLSLLSALDASVDLFLLGDWDVPSSDRAGVDPKRPCAAAVLKVLGTYEALGDKRSVAKIDQLAAKHAALPGVADAAKQAGAAAGAR